MSSSWNIQVFKYTVIVDLCCDQLTDTLIYQASTTWVTPWPCKYCKISHQWSKQITKSIKTKPCLELFLHCISLSLLENNQNNWYLCSIHSEIMTWVSFYCRLMKNGLLWRQQHSIIWMWILSLLTYLLPDKCALLVKSGQQKQWESAQQCTKTMALASWRQMLVTY